MSLEAAVKENTEAVLKLAEISSRLLELRANAIETVKSAAAPAEKPAKATKAEKPAAEEPKANISESPEDRKDPAAEAAGPSHDSLEEVITKYMATNDAEQRAARKSKVLEMFAVIASKAGVEVKGHLSVPAKFLGAAVKTVENLIAKGDVPVAQPAGDDLLG